VTAVRGTEGFDRLRTRTPRATPPSGIEVRDADGKRALFSASVQPPLPAFGSATVECQSCGETSALSARQALRTAVPSLHLLFLKREYPSYLRCPACTRFSWTKVSLHI
jgi:hypothetical protein